MAAMESTLGMSREKWLTKRKKGIGGSDAGAICGLNPYASPLSVYLDKTTEEISSCDNEAMRQGRELEDYVAKWFVESTGMKVRRSNVMYQNQEYPFMIADVDRVIIGEDAGLECKTASAYNADKWKNGEIPAHYMIQCYHYMAVTGKRAWYIAVLILGQDFKYAKLEWDKEIIQNLIEVESGFWNKHVIPKCLPDPDGTKASEEVLEKYFRISKKGSEIPLVGFDNKLRRRQELMRLIDKLDVEKSQIEQEVKLFMKENELAASERFRVSWSEVCRKQLDSGRLKTENPMVYEDYLKVTSSRRFYVKAV